MVLRLDLMLAACIVLLVALGADGLPLTPDNVYRGTDSGFNSLLVSQKSSSLYVGTRLGVAKLWLYNVNDTSLSMRRELSLDQMELEECISTGQSLQDCQVGVRAQFGRADGSLIMCVSKAMKPVLHVVDGADLKDIEPPRSAVGVCTPQSDLNTTAVFVEFGNPDDIPAIYSGIRTGQSLENYLIYRPALVFNHKEVHPALRTIYTDSQWLNEPQFVASFSMNQYVYFFFREVAVETDNCGRNVFSRVARVCKNDLGGKNVLHNAWSSFVKARLNCSIPGPFQFDHLESVALADIGSDQLFYTTFTTTDSALQSSALCYFSLRTINQLFDTGLFLERPSVHASWGPTPIDKVRTFRPGSCAADSRTLSDSDLHFAKSHMLMSDPVPAGPALPLVFEKKASLKVLADTREGQVLLFVHNQRSHEVYKVLHWLDAEELRQLATYTLNNDKVNDLAILPGEYLYVATEQAVSQYRLGQCSSYSSCWACASDPFCSWNVARVECFSRDAVHSTAVGWVTDVSNAERCHSYALSEERRLLPGDSVHLQCPAEAIRPTWLFDSRPIHADSSNVIRTVGGGLILLNATRHVSGTYQCVQNGIPLAEYVVVMDDSDCAQPRSIAQFHSIQREWCKKLQSYKSNISKWQRLHDENSECPSIPPQLQGQPTTDT